MKNGNEKKSLVSNEKSVRGGMRFVIKYRKDIFGALAAGKGKINLSGQEGANSGCTGFFLMATEGSD